MSGNQDAYRRVGRGGAGNFYSAKPGEDAASKVRPQPFLPQPQPTRKSKSFPWFSWFKSSQSGKPSNTRPHQDLEAQKPTAAAVDPTEVAAANTSNVPGQYARAGRGGAGNFFEPETARQQQKEEDKAAASVKPASQQHATSGMALGGRGGAGNYHQKQQKERDPEGQDKKMDLKEMEKKVMDHVEVLAKPAKAVLAHERK